MNVDNYLIAISRIMIWCWFITMAMVNHYGNLWKRSTTTVIPHVAHHSCERVRRAERVARQLGLLVGHGRCEWGSGWNSGTGYTARCTAWCLPLGRPWCNLIGKTPSWWLSRLCPDKYQRTQCVDQRLFTQIQISLVFQAWSRDMFMPLKRLF